MRSTIDIGSVVERIDGSRHMVIDKAGDYIMLSVDGYADNAYWTTIFSVIHIGG